MRSLELRDQLALARLGVVGDFPAEVRGVGGVIEQAADELAAQGARGADVDQLIVVPRLSFQKA